jgi:tetratricopeptide (TPR) repeat protein
MKTIIFIVLAALNFQNVNAQIDSADYFLKEGNKKFDSELYSAAQKDYEQAIRLNPSFTEAYIASGNADMKTSRIYQAGQNFNKAYQLDPENKVVIKALMEWNFNNRQNKKAIEFAEKCNCEETDRIKGMSYYRMEDYGQAEKYLLKVLKNNPKDAEAAYSLAQTYLEMENDKLAITYYQMAVDNDHKRGNWQYELALLYYNANDYMNALKCFNNAISAGYQENNDFLENMGFCQLYAGEIENAMKSLNQVIERKPNNATLMSDIAYAMYFTKRYQGAVEFYEKALTIDSKDAHSLYMAGMSFQKMGQKEKGQKICDAAIKMDPSLAKNRQKKEMSLGL